MSLLACAVYKPYDREDQRLLKLVKKHGPLLKSQKLITDGTVYVATSENGCIVEIFEWASPTSKDLAHQTAVVLDHWDKMAEVCDFVALDELAEAKSTFANFKIVS